MSARLPLLGKTPFVLITGGWRRPPAPTRLLCVSRAYGSLGIPAMIEANLPLRKRERGFSEAQIIESVVLLQVAGGECPEDIRVLADDACLERGGTSAGHGNAGEFLERFHDKI